MSEYCFLCLTDEGVFIDITSTNYKSLRGDVETFLSLKVNKDITNKNRVCYKCAFELKQCSDFLKKYKEARKALNSKIYKRKCCIFCLETRKKGYIFHLNSYLHPLNNLDDNIISKVQQLFQDDFVEFKEKIMLMCLTCRYSLDVLFDLRSLYLELSKERDIFDKNKDYSTLPKVNTIIVKRKTTVTASMKTRSYILSNPDSDSSTKEENSEVKMNKDVASTRPKPRFCDACKISVKNGEDMYRFYKTRLTVCKTCWTSIDPTKCIRRLKKPIRTNTKLCAVFLKDVLTDVTFKKHKAYKVEKDSYGNNLYIITDSESEVDVEDKIDTEPQGKLSNRSGNKPKPGQKRSKAGIKSESSDNEMKSIKRMKHDKETTSKVSKLRDTNPMKKKSTTRIHYSDTDVFSNNTLRITRAAVIKQGNKKVYSLSDIDIKKSQRKTRSITSGNVKEMKEENISDDSSFTEDSTKEKNSNEQSIITSKSHASNYITRKRKKTKSISSSTSTSESTSSDLKNSAPKRLRKTFVTKSKNFEEEISSDDTYPDETDLNKKKKYICRECGIKFENKLKLVTHELTHFKKLELKLHRLMIQDKCGDEKKVDELSKKKFNDELNEQQNEEITLSLNDDEESETANVKNQIDVTENTIKSDKDTECSLVKNEKKDSLQNVTTDKEEGTKESEMVETKSICEDSIKVIENKDRTPESTEQIESMVTLVENNNTSKDIDNDQNQNSGSNNNTIEDVEQLKKKREEINEKDEDKNKEKINEKVEDEKNKNIEEHDNDTKEKEEDKVEEVKEDNVKEKEDTIKEKENIAKDKDDDTKETETKINEKENDKAKESNINEMEINTNQTENNTNETKNIKKKIKDETNDKNETTNETEDETNKRDDIIEEKANETEERGHKMNEIEISKLKKEEQNNSKDLNSNNSVLNVDNPTENLNEEDEKSTDNKDEKNETDKEIIDNDGLKNCNESNITASNAKSIKDNSNSVEEIDKQVDISDTTHSPEEKEYTNDAQKLLSDLTTLNETATCKESQMNNKII